MKATELLPEHIKYGDSFSIELGNCILESGIIGFRNDGVVILGDAKTLALLKASGAILEDVESMLREGKMSEVNALMQDIASDNADIYEILYYPTDSVEKYVQSKLEEMVNNISVDYDLSVDQDLEKILDMVKLQLKDQYGDLNEAEYQGRKVPLGKPMAGDVKKSKVYVKGPKGNVVKVNFGDPNMKIKKSNPKRRKSFRARHNCDNPGPRWKARYWSCRAW